MNETKTLSGRASERGQEIGLPLLVIAFTLAIWVAVSAARLYLESVFPAPWSVWQAFIADVRDGSLWRDLIVSVWRVSCGFFLATLVGIPLGLAIGLSLPTRRALLPAVNFLRNLSPLAWITFAIIWFGIGDAPAIFLIFMAATFPLTLATFAAVTNIPSVYFRVASDYGLTGLERLTEVILPAILPQIITALRVTAGLAWVVLVAAEMVAGQDGLGFLILDARNGLRTDRLVSAMIVIGVIGVLIDRFLLRLTHLKSVRWGYER